MDAESRSIDFYMIEIENRIKCQIDSMAKN